MMNTDIKEIMNADPNMHWKLLRKGHYIATAIMPEETTPDGIMLLPIHFTVTKLGQGRNFPWMATYYVAGDMASKTLLGDSHSTMAEARDVCRREAISRARNYRTEKAS